MDNQNPSAILGTKKFTSGILIGCAIGLLFTVITGVLSYNYALKLKYDDYKAKVFTEQAKIEQDCKSNILSLKIINVINVYLAVKSNDLLIHIWNNMDKIQNNYAEWKNPFPLKAHAF